MLFEVVCQSKGMKMSKNSQIYKFVNNFFRIYSFYTDFNLNFNLNMYKKLIHFGTQPNFVFK